MYKITRASFSINSIVCLVMIFIQIMLNAQGVNEMGAQGFAKRYPIIPRPVHLIPAEGVFTIDKSTRITINSYTKDTKELAFFIADFLSAALGSPIEVTMSNRIPERNSIHIMVDEQLDIEPEGYLLSVDTDGIVIKARTTTGAFWGFQTLRQLMLPHVERHSSVTECTLPIPCLQIKDFPRFSYRGLLLDVGRHIFPVECIKKYIDLLSAYKLNKFHWHLTDDQGWRIEIKKYPKLQEIAAYRNETLIGHSKNLWPQFDKKRYGGYYTQQEVKHIVEYARLRHVTIIPEIELPGHCLAALAAYPELGCTNGPYKTATKWGIFDDVYCAGSENTFQFLEDVLSEVLSLFPSSYIHIGGDEVRKLRWKNCLKCRERIKKENLKDENELQSYFIRRIEDFLHKHGRQIIGWDEILEEGSSAQSIIMVWRGIDKGIKAAQKNYNVIMTPAQWLYFDHYQTRSQHEPLAIGGYTTLKDVYYYEPIPTNLTTEEAKHILGVQANVWTEYIPTFEHIEYMTYPRAIALAEISWTSTNEKNYENFMYRLRANRYHLEAMNVHYAVHALDETDFTRPTILTKLMRVPYFLKDRCTSLVYKWIRILSMLFISTENKDGYRSL